MKTEIEKFEPCPDAIAFRNQYATFEDAWQACPPGDWMLWIAEQSGVDIRLLTLAKGHCAATILHLMEDERSRKAVEIAIAFGEGKASLEELHKVAEDAFDAYYYAKFHSAAAYSAASSKFPAYCAAGIYANRKMTADICRKYLTDAVMKKLQTL
jgi:hypothetical protein